jgi:hypothetical protein
MPTGCSVVATYLTDGLCPVASAVGRGVAGDVVASIANSFAAAADKSIQLLVTGWTDIPTPSVAGGTTSWLQAQLQPVLVFVGAICIIAAMVRMVWTNRAEPAREMLAGLLRLVVISGAGLAGIDILLAAGDAFSSAILNAATPNGRNFGHLVVLGSQVIPESGLLVILALIAILTSLIQIFLLVARGGLVVVLGGTWPLAAAASSTPAGNAWFKKTTAWLLAFILFKPVASIIYAAGLRLALSKTSGGLATVEGVIFRSREEKGEAIMPDVADRPGGVFRRQRPQSVPGGVSTSGVSHPPEPKKDAPRDGDPRPPRPHALRRSRALCSWRDLRRQGRRRRGRPRHGRHRHQRRPRRRSRPRRCRRRLERRASQRRAASQRRRPDRRRRHTPRWSGTLRPQCEPGNHRRPADNAHLRRLHRAPGGGGTGDRPRCPRRRQCHPQHYGRAPVVMTTTDLAPKDEFRTYGGWRRRGRPGLGQLGFAPTILLFIGLLAAIAAMAFSLRLAVGVALANAAVLAPIVVSDRHHRSALQGLAARAWWLVGHSAGRHLYRSGPTGALPTARWSLPGLGATIGATSAVDAAGRPFALLHHPGKHTATAVIQTSPQGATLVDDDTIDHWVASWGEFLAALGQEPSLVGASVTIETAPDPGTRLATELHRRMKPNAPHLARSVLEEIMASASRACALWISRSPVT